MGNQTRFDTLFPKKGHVLSILSLEVIKGYVAQILSQSRAARFGGEIVFVGIKQQKATSMAFHDVSDFIHDGDML